MPDDRLPFGYNEYAAAARSYLHSLRTVIEQTQQRITDTRRLLDGHKPDGAMPDHEDRHLIWPPRPTPTVLQKLEAARKSATSKAASAREQGNTVAIQIYDTTASLIAGRIAEEKARRDAV